MKTLVDAIKEGWATASDQMQRNRDVSHTIFGRGFYKDFGLSRHVLRELAHEGNIPGLTKSSW